MSGVISALHIWVGLHRFDCTGLLLALNSRRIASECYERGTEMTKEEGDHVKGMGMCDGQRPSLMVSVFGGKRMARVV
jgi:hypothetical protein